MIRRLGRRGIVLVAVLAIAIITVMVAAISAGAAGTKVRSTTSVSVGSQVRLVSGGANVSVTYTCFPGGYSGGKGGYSDFGDLRLGDINGHQGFVFFRATCDNKKHTSVVFVPGSFVAGPGAVSAFICGFDCNGTSRQVKIS
jgi:hypothetical protein